MTAILSVTMNMAQTLTLIDPGGNPIETWRADYPYEERMERRCTNSRNTHCRSNF